MANRNNYIAIGLVVAALCIVLYLLYLLGGASHSWKTSYRNTDKEPYGTVVLYKLLKDYFPDHELITIKEETIAENNVLDSNLCCSNYVFIGRQYHQDSLGIENLLSYVSNGNIAFIAANIVPDKLIEDIGIEEVLCAYWDGYSEFKDTVVNLNLNHPKLQLDSATSLRRLYNFETQYNWWNYINQNEWCDYDIPAAQLGTVNGKTNFLSISVGSGKVLLHTTPLAFTNYQLIDSTKQAYTQAVLSHLQEGDIYWDERARTYVRSEYSNSTPPESPLRFILQNRSLKWAWYLMIATVLVYVFFHMKRRQKAIPVIHPVENTSIEFIQTIGSLYLSQNDHKKLALQQYKQFLVQLRNRYQININQTEEDLVKDIARRAKVDAKHVKRIFSRKKSIDLRQSIEAADLIEFHKLIEHFYKTAK